AQRGLLINNYLLSLLGAFGEETALSNDKTSADDKLQHELEDSAFEILCVSLPEVLRYTFYANNFFKHVVTCLNGSEEVDVDLAERSYRVARYSLDVAVTLTCICKSLSRKEDLIWNIDAMEANCIDDLSEVALIRYIGHLTSPIEVRYHDAVINCLLLAYKIKLINKTTHSNEYLGHLLKLSDYFQHASTFNRQVLLAIHKGLCVVEGPTSRSPEEKDKINQVLEMIHQALPETQDPPSLS
ncbi:MAG TPA: hypothetical protein VGO47_09865, partial [Chlamydiales bacterium]|nr:hypothetical protein [Chlamydiales bacterium]